MLRKSVLWIASSSVVRKSTLWLAPRGVNGALVLRAMVLVDTRE